MRFHPLQSDSNGLVEWAIVDLPEPKDLSLRDQRSLTDIPRVSDVHTACPSEPADLRDLRRRNSPGLWSVQRAAAADSHGESLCKTDEEYESERCYVL